MKIHLMLLIASLGVVPFVFAADGSGRPQMSLTHGEHGGHEHMGGMSDGRKMGRPVTWSSLPLLKIRSSGESREQMVVSAVPQNIVAGGIDAWSNNLNDEGAHRQLQMEMGGAKLDKPSSGGFHWLSAREEQADKVLVASTVYSFNERNAKDPTAMFMQQKHELEIIPQPYPREHSRYRANEDWKFLVRFNGQPLANQKVLLETQNGSKAEFVSGAQGVVTIHFPNDFKPEEEVSTGMRSRMRSSDWVLAIEHPEGGKTHLTAFNGVYAPDAFDKRNLVVGMGFTLLGMIGALPLLGQRKTKKGAASGASGNEGA